LRPFTAVISIMKLARAFAFTIVGLLALPIATGAQQPAYRIASTDTLRWIDETIAEMEPVNRSGERADSMRFKSHQRRWVSLTPVRGDTVRLWFDSLAVSNEVDGKRMELPTQQLGQVSVMLDIDRSGRVARPRWSSQNALQPRTDLTSFSSELADFFLPLPREPLAVGVSWQDTTSLADSASSGAGMMATQQETRIARYRVLRDTTVNGRPALVISTTTETRTTGTVRAADFPGGGVTSLLVKADSGFFVFDAVAGRLLGRRTTGEMRMQGGPVAESGTTSSLTRVFRFSQRTDAVMQ
jgi:hypothetical protein